MPFRFSYGHAKSTHQYVESIICIFEDEQGLQGLGEAVPRTYVTGETPTSVLNQAEKLLKGFSGDPNDEDSFVDYLSTSAEQHHGAFPSCSYSCLNIAYKDLFAQQKQKAVYTMNLDSQQGIEYTASIGMGSKTKLFPKLLLYKLLGLKRFKIKLGDEDDIRRFKWIKKILGNQCSFYGDANGAWDKEKAIQKITNLKEIGLWGIEEPLYFEKKIKEEKGVQLNREDQLNDSHYQNYHWLKERVELPIIADESLISPMSLEQIIQSDSFDILNIRLSKCGGFDLSQQMIDKGCKAGLDYGICAMVGESGISANAGAQFALINNSHRMVQGFSHKLLHKKQLVSGGASLKRGKLSLPQSHGLGLKLIIKNLSRVTVNKISINL